MACGKYGINSKERSIWDVRGKMAVAIITGKSLEEVAADYEITVEALEAEIEAIKEENPVAYQQVKDALANRSK